MEWLPPGGHIPQWRLEAAAAHHGGFKPPLRRTRTSGEFSVQESAVLRHNLNPPQSRVPGFNAFSAPDQSPVNPKGFANNL
jgi:hypothetical protein